MKNLQNEKIVSILMIIIKIETINIVRTHSQVEYKSTNLSIEA